MVLEMVVEMMGNTQGPEKQTHLYEPTFCHSLLGMSRLTDP